jgi:hypothetical protein
MYVKRETNKVIYLNQAIYLNQVFYLIKVIRMTSLMAKNGQSPHKSKKSFIFFSWV